MSQEIWNSFGRALGAEPTDRTVIRGVSGIDHRLLSLSVDEQNKRLILVSADPDPRITAMMHVDVQGTFPEMKVLVARPIIIDLAVIARHSASKIGKREFRLSYIKKKFDSFTALSDGRKKRRVDSYVEQFSPAVNSMLTNVTLPTFTQIGAAISQAVYFDWERLVQKTSAEDSDPLISLKPLLELDNLEMDRRHGICSVPLYEFKENDWELFRSGARPDDIRERMQTLGVYQYFYPPPDQLALGLVDRGLERIDSLQAALALSPSIGHPYGHVELVGENVRLNDIIDNLHDRGLVVEGELGLTLTKTGSTARATVKFRPRESLLTKLLNRMRINISASPRDF